MNWLNRQTNNLIPFPNGLVKAVFDNNQKIRKTYLITGTNIVPSVVMTSHLWICLDKDNLIQSDPAYNGEQRMWKQVNQSQQERLFKFYWNQVIVLEIQG